LSEVCHGEGLCTKDVVGFSLKAHYCGHRFPLQKNFTVDPTFSSAELIFCAGFSVEVPRGWYGKSKIDKILSGLERAALPIFCAGFNAGSAKRWLGGYGKARFVFPASSDNIVPALHGVVRIPRH